MLSAIESGAYSQGKPESFRPLVLDLRGYAPLLLCTGHRSYVDAWGRAAEAYGEQESWTRSAILNVAHCGFFSSDRSMREYCRETWKLSPLHVSNHS